MNSKERMMTALARKTPDLVPVFLRDLTLGLDVLGLTTPEVCNGGPHGHYDAEKSAEAVVACWRTIWARLRGWQHSRPLPHLGCLGWHNGIPDFWRPSRARVPICGKVSPSLCQSAAHGSRRSVSGLFKGRSACQGAYRRHRGHCRQRRGPGYPGLSIAGNAEPGCGFRARPCIRPRSHRILHGKSSSAT